VIRAVSAPSPSRSCLVEAVTNKGIEGKLEAEAVTKGVKVFEISPWVSGAMLASCIIFGTPA